MPTFKSVLYLDDIRIPVLVGIDLVKNYDQFVAYLTKNGIPDLISFDHDLDTSHYPLGHTDVNAEIDYDSFQEKTGLHCARYIVENNLPLRNWAVHSYNPKGRANIEAELRRYRPRGEMRNLQIPFDVEPKHQHLILPMLGLAKPPVQRCCEKDTDGDGNCPDHIAAGHYRNPELARATLRSTVFDALQPRVDDNMYSIDGETDEMVAIDLTMYEARLEDTSVRDIVPFVREFRESRGGGQ